jgi:hypothetical protein
MSTQSKHTISRRYYVSNRPWYPINNLVILSITFSFVMNASFKVVLWFHKEFRMSFFSSNKVMVGRDNVQIGRFYNTFFHFWIRRNGFNIAEIVMIRFILRPSEEIPLVSEALEKFVNERNCVEISAIPTILSSNTG